MTSTIRTFTKKPESTLDYSFDWSEWLDEGDTIAAVEWSIPGELTQPTSATQTPTSATAWIGGGVAGSDYVVSCEITTTQNRTDARAILVRVRP